MQAEVDEGGHFAAKLMGLILPLCVMGRGRASTGFAPLLTHFKRSNGKLLFDMKLLFFLLQIMIHRTRDDVRVYCQKGEANGS